ncbi:hypothetical protein [Psychroserpens sp.]|uniref:hypothetical protein n=1 Tax=Psychroserpens sp. TaxID=2020870 RepID=UPI003C762F58
MLSKKQKLISLIIIVILTFIIGMKYEMDYRNLTRNLVKYFANYKLDFYGGKEFRLFETDIAFILTLIPFGFYFTYLKINSLKKILSLILFYLILVPLFFCFYCFIESIYLNIIITQPRIEGEIINFHFNNVNYRMILFLTIISTFISGIIFKKITKWKKPVANTV